MQKYSWAYLMGRLPIAMSMLGHGLVRLPKLDKFTEGMVTEFSKTALPVWLVTAFGYSLPFLELITGILLVLGLWTRVALNLGLLVMLILIFGSTMVEQWQNVAMQLFYGVYFAVLYLFVSYNHYSVDRLITGPKTF
jgi:thiosulfate dehydrogenase [quinone] large subunit